MQIAQLAWLLFAVGTAVLLVVIIALCLAMRGPAEIRSRMARDGTVMAAGIAFPATVLTGLLGLWRVADSTRAFRRPNSADITRIEVIGEQWWWRIAYSHAGGRRIASANEIRIPIGREVEFTLKSADVIHSFWIPNLGGKVDMVPGRTTRLRLRADRQGVFRGQCAEYCGGAHALMAISVIAMPATEFETWLEFGGSAGGGTDNRGRHGEARRFSSAPAAAHVTPSAARRLPEWSDPTSRISARGARSERTRCP